MPPSWTAAILGGLLELQDCLPSELRGPATVLTAVSSGLSGARVYRVDAAGQQLVLKIAGEAEADPDWRRALQIQRLAARAGLSPRVVHVDEARRAVVTVLVEDRSFARFYRDPLSHEAALIQLGRAVRRIHSLPIPADARHRDPRELLAQLWTGLQSGGRLPKPARAAIEAVLSEPSPTSGRPWVLGHNDLNPTNLIFDGQAIAVLDWAAAGIADPFYDLAVLAVFLRMDEDTRLRLLSIYDAEPVVRMLDGFAQMRRLAATLAGTMQLTLARQVGHPGSLDVEPITLAEFYPRLVSGALRMGTPEGHWAFGMALLNESVAP